MTDNELLLAISNMMDKKLEAQLQPIKNDLTGVKITLENNILPRLQNIEACYTSIYDRYKNDADKMESVIADVQLLKDVVGEHSKKLEHLSA